MIKNVGIADRYARIAVGIAVLALAFVGPRTPWGLLGVIPLLTGLSRFCPVYRIAGVDTCGLHH